MKSSQEPTIAYSETNEQKRLNDARETVFRGRSGDHVRAIENREAASQKGEVTAHIKVEELAEAIQLACYRDTESFNLKLAKLRDPRCSKTEQEIAEQLSGHWREDHLFSLQRR